jgi:hypothetical protein
MINVRWCISTPWWDSILEHERVRRLAGQRYSTPVDAWYVDATGKLALDVDEAVVTVDEWVASRGVGPRIIWRDPQPEKEVGLEELLSIYVADRATWVANQMADASALRSARLLAFQALETAGRLVDQICDLTLREERVQKDPRVIELLTRAHETLDIVHRHRNVQRCAS